MNVKAKLKIVLQADDTIVAESEDAGLWQRVLVAMTQGGSVPAVADASPLPPAPIAKATNGLDDVPGDDIVGKLAQQIGVSRAEVEGACAPSTEAPYMHLDLHCWEEMKRQTGERGPTAVSPIGLALTLLALWFRTANLGNPTQAQAQDVLSTINIRDKNATRAVQRADWLQARPGGVVVLNPSQISKAKSLARSFCLKQWKSRTDE